MKIRMLLLPILLCGAVLPACGEDSRSAEPSTKDCPDLTGTYEARIPAWAGKFYPFALRTGIPTRQFATFQRRDGGFTLIWHTSRQDFLAAARLLAQRNPYRYDGWLDMMLRDPKRPLPLGVSSARDWNARIASAGPVLRALDEALPIRQCKRGWFLFSGRAHRKGPPDFEGGMDGTRDLEMWLGRDPDGSLSLKVEEHRTVILMYNTMYTPYLAIRLWSSARSYQWPAAPAQDLAPIHAEELPQRNRPPRFVPKCQIADDHEALFFQRLKANLPPGVTIENRSSSIIHGRMRPDGICDPTPYTVTVSAPDAASIAKVADYLRTDPFIRRIDSQEPIGNGGLLVKFRMMAAPWEIGSGTPGEPSTLLNTQ